MTQSSNKPPSISTIRDVAMGILMVGFAAAILFVPEVKSKAITAFFSEKWVNVFGALILLYGLWRLLKGLFLNRRYD